MRVEKVGGKPSAAVVISTIGGGLGWLIAASGLWLAGLMLAAFVFSPEGWRDVIFLTAILLPLLLGLAWGIGLPGKVPRSDLALMVAGTLLFASAALSWVGLVIWGPPGFLLFGAGLGKAVRCRLLTSNVLASERPGGNPRRSRA